MINSERVFIKEFSPEMEVLNKPFQDCFYDLLDFNAGDNYKVFNEFLLNDTIDYNKAGEGVTHLIINTIKDDKGSIIRKEIVAYITLAVNSIPFVDRIRNDEEEYITTGEKYNEENCGISAVEIKMYAVDEKYQDVFYESENESLPIAAWILRMVINWLYEISENIISFKAIFLHSLPEDVEFYKKNEFEELEENMQPFFSVDEDFTPLYLALREVHMNYDD